MARSSRSFKLATQASVEEAKAAYEEIEFEFIDPDAPLEKGRKTPTPRICVARYPGEGEMFAMAASVGLSDDQLRNPAGSLFSFLRATFDKSDYAFIYQQVKLSRLDPREDLMEMIFELMTTWSGVPTKQ